MIANVMKLIFKYTQSITLTRIFVVFCVFVMLEARETNKTLRMKMRTGITKR